MSAGKLESWLFDQLSSLSPGIFPISAKRLGERLPDIFSVSSLYKLEKDAGKVFSELFFKYKLANAVSVPISVGNIFSRALSFRRSSSSVVATPPTVSGRRVMRVSFKHNSCKFFRLPISAGSSLSGKCSSRSWRNFFNAPMLAGSLFRRAFLMDRYRKLCNPPISAGNDFSGTPSRDNDRNAVSLPMGIGRFF